MRFLNSSVQFVLLFFFLIPINGQSYYVSPSGEDSNPGTRQRPWRTISRANSHEFGPGESLLFEGGRVFRGTLSLDREDSGSSQAPVTIDSFGDGRAVLDAGKNRAIEVDGTSHLRIRNLKIVGSGRKTGNSESGIYLTGAENIEIDSIEVSGFRYSGLYFTGVTQGKFTRIHAHQNGFSGISSHGDWSREIYVGHCLTENNPGDPTILNNHSGNGIVLGKVRGATIEYCESRYNGWDMPRKGNGPVGIWAYHSDRVVIQYNIAHHNRSTGTDGGGFDFDGGMTNSVLQYNYSHNNHGTGYLICQYKGAAPFRNNVVRYNISQDDGLSNHDAGIFLWQGDKGMDTTLVHNNTIYNSKGSAVGFGAADGVDREQILGRFYNNIFVSGEGQITGGAHKGEFKGNLYWAMGDGGFLVDGYTSLEDWAESTGQEKIGEQLVGIFADPKLAKNGTGLLNDPNRRKELGEYLLLTSSPAVDRALNLQELIGVAPGLQDYYGNLLPQGAGFDIGAHELVR